MVPSLSILWYRKTHEKPLLRKSDSSTEGFGSALDWMSFCCELAPKQYDITLTYITLSIEVRII